MSLTKITNRVIEPNTITANSLAEGISLGGGGPKISNVSVANSSYSILDDTAIALEGGYLVITGTGFETGCQVIVGSNNATSTTFVNSTTLRAQVGAADAGSKAVYVVNPDGGTAIRVNGLTYSGFPTWSTGSTLDESNINQSISVQLSASSDSTVTYQLQSGSTLPPGLSLSSSGLLSGAVTGISATTNYNFTIEATDIELQNSPRTFNINIIVQFTAGWFAGGAIAPGSISTIDRITYSNDTVTASVRGPLSAVRRYSTGVNNNDNGWFGGGYGTFGNSSLVERITFITDTTSTSTRGPLSLARRLFTSTSNDNYGWFGGGYGPAPSPGNKSRVDRITFAADTNTASVRGSFNTTKVSSAGSGNDDYGWYAGGSTETESRIARITYSNDTGTTTLRGALNDLRGSLSGVGNNNFGWYAGGLNLDLPQTLRSRIDRLTYSTDTNATVARGNLGIASNYMGSSTNDNYGWFGGGRVSALSSRVFRITYSDDTVTTSTRGPLSTAKTDSAGTSGIA